MRWFWCGLVLWAGVAMAQCQSPFGLCQLDWTHQLISVHYASAVALAKLIKGEQVLPEHAILLADKRTNSLWVMAPEKVVHRVVAVIQDFDRPARQVLIKARIVSIDARYVHELGLKFQRSFPLAHFSEAVLLNTRLTALVESGHAKIVSSPELMASNRESAFIESGEDIPYQEEAESGGTSVAFKKAALRLAVTPTLLPHSAILLKLTVTQDKVSHLSINGVPAIKTQTLKTNVLLKNKQTLVLGGIYETVAYQQSVGVPVLDDLPIVGKIFGEQETRRERKELLLFVTPVVE